MTGRNVFQRKSLISGIRNSLLTQTRTWRRKSLAVSAILPTHLTLNLFQRLRCQSSVPTSPRVCIVGSGPAGFYTAQQLLKVLTMMKSNLKKNRVVSCSMTHIFL